MNKLNKKILLIISALLASCATTKGATKTETQNKTQNKTNQVVSENDTSVGITLEQAKAAARKSLLKDELNFSSLKDLHYAAGWGTVPLARQILKRDGKVDVKDDKSRTPLYLAAGFNNDEQVLAKLIDKGADVNKTNILGSAPLHWAAGSAALPQTQLLVAKDARWDVRDKMNRTPLAVAKNPPRSISTAAKQAEVQFLEARK
ncbi:MAG: ankyrin repeat domain-containing protein [Spirochaetota bacterium]